MRHHPIPEGIFKPRPTAIVTRHDATTKAARTIVDDETAVREQKTERLRLTRLAREATDAIRPVVQKRTVKRKRT